MSAAAGNVSRQGGASAGSGVLEVRRVTVQGEVLDAVAMMLADSADVGLGRIEHEHIGEVGESGTAGDSPARRAAQPP